MATDLFTLRTYWNPVEAHIARNQLEAEGIRAVVTDEGAGTLFGNQLAGAKLLVEGKDAARAAEILGLLDEEEEAEPPPDYWKAGAEDPDAEDDGPDDDETPADPGDRSRDLPDEITETAGSDPEDEEDAERPLMMESLRQTKWVIWLVLWPYILAALLLAAGLLWLVLSLLR